MCVSLDFSFRNSNFHFRMVPVERRRYDTVEAEDADDERKPRHRDEPRHTRDDRDRRHQRDQDEEGSDDERRGRDEHR